MLNLRLVRGPLEQRQNEQILKEYNRLTSSQIPMNEFLHWIQDSPDGPAWHAILETDEGEIASHSCLIPVRLMWREKQITAAKSEYSFILEEFRGMKIRGFEHSTRLKNLTIIDELFRHCESVGWGPLLISTSAAVHRLYRSVGCYPLNFSVWECLFILRPWRAAWRTPNLSRLQRLLLFFSGVLQRLVWSIISLFSPAEKLFPVKVGEVPSEDATGFFVDSDSRRWRYPERQYEVLALDAKCWEHIAVKKATADTYLRVCDWRHRAGEIAFSAASPLIAMAESQKALGVRWAVYGNDQEAAKTVRSLRRFGFLCVRRVRTLLIYSKEKEFLQPKNWSLTDAFFSFDP